MSETVLITGASSGIGLELGKLFASAGNDLILVARSETKLNELSQQLIEEHSVHVEVIIADLAEVDAAEKLFAETERRKLIVDVLVNNAGFGELGRFVEIPIERQINMVRLNVETLVHLSRLYLPEMVKRKSGGILNVGSTAAFQPGPHMAVYYATKAFVLSFSEALHEEMLESGIAVTCLCPGPTSTGFGKDSGMENLKIFKGGVMDAAVVAKAGYQAFRQRKAIVIPGFKNKFGAFLTRLFPRFLIRKLVKSFQKVD